MANPLAPDARPAVGTLTVRRNFMIAASGGGSGAGPSTVHHVAHQDTELTMPFSAALTEQQTDDPTRSS